MSGLPNSQHEHSENSALRRQLEGGLELLEAAASRYRELSAVLLARGWKRRLRRAPTLVADTLAVEASLPEVLTRLRQRAAREPEGSMPASRFLHQFEAERTRLWRAMGRRLSLNEETLSLSEGTLEERLERLRTRVIKPRALPPALRPLRPGAGEPLLLEGTGWFQPLMAAVGLLSPFVTCALPVLLQEPVWWWLALALLVPSWAFFLARSGHYWLTSERLVWQPRWGQPVELPLSSIGEHNISVSSWNSVTVQSPDGLSVRHVPHAIRLAELLSIRRRKEFHGAAASRDPRRLCAVLTVSSTRPGEQSDPDEPQVWTAVLRPGFVAFFRGLEGDPLLDAITEPTELVPAPTWLSRVFPARSRDRIPVPLDLLLEQILLLPEERMDAMLRKAASADTQTNFWAPESFLWEARELQWSLLGGSSLELSRADTAAMRANLSWLESQVVQQLIEQWTVLQQLPRPIGEVARDEPDQAGTPAASKLSSPEL